jgi:transposase
MKKRFTLTEEEQRTLQTNPHIASCSARMIQYTPDFKRYALREYTKGKHPTSIFTEAGISLECLGTDYAREKLRMWRKLVDKHGMQYFDAEHRGNHGAALAAWRQKTKRYDTMTKEQKIAYLEAENEALEYVRRHFGLPPSLRKPSHSSRRRRNTKSSSI